MSTKTLFEEAIADAKAVKDMAIKNAKAALEESFAPHLQKMLSTKLQEMESEENQEEVNETENVNETEVTNETEETNEEIDLDELLKELDSVEETNLNEEETETEIETPGTEEETEESVSVEDMSEEDLKNFVEATIKEMVAAGEIEAGEGNEEEAEEVETETEEEEEVNLDEILKEINSKEENLDEAKKKTKKIEKKDDKELKEALVAIESLKSEMNEVNLLNAKLLYTNKIFKAKNLNESQKLKVLSSFDKAKTVAESKLVYETILESLKETKTKSIVESKGSASKVISSPTKTQEPIVTDLAFKRMQELAFGKK